MSRCLFVRRIWSCCVLLLALYVLFQGRPAEASCGICPYPCCFLNVDGCYGPDCSALESSDVIADSHADGRLDMEHDISDEFNPYREWLTADGDENFFRSYFLLPIQRFAEQMSVVALYQAMTIGTLIDAKQQLETQRLFQELEAQAHKDYHPSEDYCWFGTNVRSLAHSEQRAAVNRIGLSQRGMKRLLGSSSLAGADSRTDDKQGRWERFASTYCDPHDNAWNTGPSGLTLACPEPNPDRLRRNIDVDYTRLIEEPRTLDVDVTQEAMTQHEEDVMAMANNLYGHESISRTFGKESLSDLESQKGYFEIRSLQARRNVAMNSYNSIVALKSSGTSEVDNPAAPEPPDTRRYMGAILRDLGVPDDEIYQILGDRPSYYAQLEILAKKIYQNPKFFANLYDKPANVARKSVALKAIDLMLDRAMYESELRQEMVLSVLLSTRLREEFKKIDSQMPRQLNKQ